ncbi:hypothetical protein JG688_00003700 [Phytophthora aleatoria]|uniref:BED-type domain-containing protein n=1 Tax=Phytophthora aleatoria TaxID=2496075 RepID=A0A8J5JA67_9STRA|nr:hypothetical protein JG688_00003700 [Phytophthora aleatoria]
MTQVLPAHPRGPPESASSDRPSSNDLQSTLVTSVTSATVPRPRAGRQKDPAWKLVDIDEDNSVWCRRCGKLIHTQGSNHIARVRRHVNDTCVKLSKPKITDTFKPKLQPTVLITFQERFAWWVYTTGMPLYKVEHRTLLAALQVLNPSIKLPSVFQLANSFLDGAYEKSIAIMQFELDGEIMTFKTDFLESVYTGAESHNVAFLAEDARRVIAKYKFLNVELLQPEFPDVFFHGCMCHALHLLVKDMVSNITWLDHLQTEYKRLVVLFKTSHKLWFRLRQLLKAKKLNMLAMPGDTRWDSLLACINSMLAAEDVLFFVVLGRNFLDVKTKKKRQARRLVLNLVTASDFVPKLKRAVALLKVVAKPMKDFEKNGTPVSDAYRLFLDLPKSVETCLKRYPRYCGADMDPTTRRNVETLLEQWFDNEDAANEVVLELVIAKRVFRCAPSSSASERNFSTHGYIHSKLCNQLVPERVEKLVHVYFNARNIQDVDMEMYSDLDDILRLVDCDEEDNGNRDNHNADFVYE